MLRARFDAARGLRPSHAHPPHRVQPRVFEKGETGFRALIRNQHGLFAREAASAPETGFCAAASVSTVPTRSDPRKPQPAPGWTTPAPPPPRPLPSRRCPAVVPDPVTWPPRRSDPAFALAHEARSDDPADPWAGPASSRMPAAGITHGALVTARLRPGPHGSGLRFEAARAWHRDKPGLPTPSASPRSPPARAANHRRAAGPQRRPDP